MTERGRAMLEAALADLEQRGQAAERRAVATAYKQRAAALRDPVRRAQRIAELTAELEVLTNARALVEHLRDLGDVADALETGTR